MPITKKARRIMHRPMREFIEEHGKRNYHAAICDENASLRRTLDMAQDGGQVGVIISGMDCDCSQYHRESIRPAFNSVHEYKNWLDEEYEYAEGPHHVHLVHPSKIDKSRNASRDLALEAFEDGHPHVVYV